MYSSWEKAKLIVLTSFNRSIATKVSQEYNAPPKEILESFTDTPSADHGPYYWKLSFYKGIGCTATINEESGVMIEPPPGMNFGVCMPMMINLSSSNFSDIFAYDFNPYGDDGGSDDDLNPLTNMTFSTSLFNVSNIITVNVVGGDFTITTTVYSSSNCTGQMLFQRVKIVVSDLGECMSDQEGQTSYLSNVTTMPAYSTGFLKQ